MPLLLKDYFTQLCADFNGHFDDPRFEAQRLICDSFDWDYQQFFQSLNSAIITKEQAELLKQAALERLKGKPLSKIVGWREFYGRRFKVSKDTLDPRPESELLIELALDWHKKQLQNSAVKILDMGTGTGCLGLTLAAQLSQAHVDLCDISLEALAIAEQNSQDFGLSARVRCLHSSWFSKLESEHSSYDIIISNPPYIPCAQCLTLPIAVRNFDPLLALDGGADGLDAYRVLAEQAQRYLKPQGILLLEHGFDQRDSLEHIFSNKGWQLREKRDDYAGLPRILLFQQG